MEKYKDCELDVIALFDENIDMLIQEAFEKLECESITKLSNTQWNYIMSYIGFRMFPDNRLIRDNYNPGRMYFHNAYDYNAIYNITLRYILLCYRYNKIPSFMGLSLILNIPLSTIQNWNNSSLDYNTIDNDTTVYSGTSNNTVNNSVQGNNGKSVSLRPIDIYKLIVQAREGTLKNIAIDSKQVVGTLAVANNEFGWNVPGMTGKTDSVRSLTAAELPKLEITDNK